MFNSLKFLLLAFLFLTLSNNLQAQSLTWLGALGSSSQVSDISLDGSVAAGRSQNPSNNYRAFRWTPITGMEDLGTFGGDVSEAYGVSSDGSVIVGGAYTATNIRAFRWTELGGMQDIGALPGGRSFAYDISSDGNVIVGWSWNASFQPRAFRWTQSGGMQSLLTLGGNESWAEDVNSDGSVVVGRSRISSGAIRAFRWTQSTGMLDLGTLSGTDRSEAYGVSPDGSVVVGATYTGATPKAFRWTQSSGLTDLGTLGGNSSVAYSASDSVIVGFAYNSSNQQRACRWTQSTGIEDLNIVYSSLLIGGYSLNIAFSISDDQRFIAGTGWNVSTSRYEGFILDTSTLTFLDEQNLFPAEHSLEQNYPNPFNPTTVIRFHLPESGNVTLKVYDVLGSEVATLVNEEKPAGTYEVTFDAHNLSSGIYLYKLKAGDDFIQTNKMVLLR